MSNMKEIWKDIPDYEGLYQASNLGNIRSVDRVEVCGNMNRSRKGRVLKQKTKKNGYKEVTLSRDGNSKSFTVHRLATMTFLINFKDKPCVNHKDSNRANNVLDNLHMVTHSENMIHGLLFGNVIPKRGVDHSSSKLKYKEVVDIKKMLVSGYSAPYIAEKYQVSKSAIYSIKGGYNWKHVKLSDNKTQDQ